MLRGATSKLFFQAICLCLGTLILTSCSPGGNSTTGGGASRLSIQNRGSDTMIELAQAWSEAYHDASVEVAGGGSSVGIKAMIDGTTEIANASRVMADSELAEAKQKTGKAPIQHVVGYDALAIYVHKDNPLEEITIEQLKEIYAENGKITKWSDLGVKVPGCTDDKFVLVSRQNNSGTYEYFREHILGKTGKLRLGTIDQNGSKDLVKFVGSTACAIGYSGMGYKTSEVKFLKVKAGGGTGILPSVAAVHDGTYPISRPLFMYTLGEATGHIKAFIDWVRSNAGQDVLSAIGYVPLKPGERSQAASKA